MWVARVLYVRKRRRWLPQPTLYAQHNDHRCLSVHRTYIHSSGVVQKEKKKIYRKKEKHKRKWIDQNEKNTTERNEEREWVMFISDAELTSDANEKAQWKVNECDARGIGNDRRWSWSWSIFAFASASGCGWLAYSSPSATFLPTYIRCTCTYMQSTLTEIRMISFWRVNQFRSPCIWCLQPPSRTHTHTRNKQYVYEPFAGAPYPFNQIPWMMLPYNQWGFCMQTPDCSHFFCA